jgi:NADPH:quinone reductase-like Zn-dependent oxidoreductase
VFDSYCSAGERVLIHAAAGGVGQAAISICQYLGAKVYATTSKVGDGRWKRVYGVDCVDELASASGL